jgi:hypothetical protein
MHNPSASNSNIDSMTENELPRSTVCITPEVLALLVGHATSHSTTTIHGALIGQFFKEKLK